MLAPRAPFQFSPGSRPDPNQYFAHRTATGQTAELLVTAELEMLWINAAALSLAAGSNVFSLTSGRLILRHLNHEQAFRQFLQQLTTPGVWYLSADRRRWLIRAEAIAPPDAPRAFLLSLHPVDAPDRYLWADLVAATGLTASEARVIKLLVEGLRIDDAATGLGISLQTARTHVRRGYVKLGVSSREEMFASILAYRLG